MNLPTAFSIWCENCGDDVNSKSDLEVAFGMHVCKRCVEHFRYPDREKAEGWDSWGLEV